MTEETKDPKIIHQRAMPALPEKPDLAPRLLQRETDEQEATRLACTVKVTQLHK